MTQVSRFKLRPDVWEGIFNLFIETLAGIKDKKKLQNFIDDFFSPTERIIFAKRLAVAVLLAKGNDYDTIRRLIRVTPTTISKMSFRLTYEGEGLRPVIEDVLGRDVAKMFWEEIKDMIDVPIKGADWTERGKRKFARKRKIESLKKGLG